MVTAIVGLVHFGLFEQAKSIRSSPWNCLNPAVSSPAGMSVWSAWLSMARSPRISRKMRTDFRVIGKCGTAKGLAGRRFQVTYIGAVVPDTFTDGAEVVVLGTFDGMGFSATRIMTKCPSKYDTDPQYSGRKIT